MNCDFVWVHNECFHGISEHVSKKKINGEVCLIYIVFPWIWHRIFMFYFVKKPIIALPKSCPTMFINKIMTKRKDNDVTSTAINRKIVSFYHRFINSYGITGREIIKLLKQMILGFCYQLSNRSEYVFFVYA